MEICAWHQNEDGAWETSCGEIFKFINGTPMENKFAFCPYCGKRIEDYPYEPEDTSIEGDLYSEPAKFENWTR